MKRHGGQPREPREPDESGDLVWGRHPVAAALDEGRVTKLWLSKGADGLEELLRKARERRVVFQWVDRQRIAAMAPGQVHQGAVARVSSYQYKELEDLFAQGTPSPIVLLDGVTDPHNLGAIIRNAAFLGAHGVVIPRWRSAGLTGVVAKAAAGALEHIPLVQVANIAQTILDLKKKNYWVYGADANGEAAHAFAWNGPLALVIGAEGEGLHRLVRERCDALVAIPGARAGVPSLNASAASAVLLYALARRSAKA